jgi:hypothetical protein
VATGQTYANHVYRPVAWSITWLLAVIAELLLLWSVVTQPLTTMTVGMALLGAAAVLTISLLRVFALRLQNRIIRSEMHLRLQQIGRAADLTRLAMPQLVALRFASDAELAGLIAADLGSDQARGEGLAGRFSEDVNGPEPEPGTRSDLVPDS